MEKLNLMFFYLEMVRYFGVTGFDVSSIKPKYSEQPKDLLIKFNSPIIRSEDFDIKIMDKIVSGLEQHFYPENAPWINYGLKEGVISIYIEFVSSDSTHWDNQGV